jgi:DNA-binding GntR family transcriptional regulator
MQQGSDIREPSTFDLAKRIEDDVMLGELPSGAWLRLVDMEQRYAAGSFEVRAALSRLAAQQLLEHIANRGYRVPVLTDEEVGQRIAVRLLLEVPIAVMLAGRATAAELGGLRELARAFEMAIEHKTPAELDRCNHDFHRAVWRLGGNPVLESLINTMRERTRPSGWRHWKTVARRRASAREHFRFVDLLEKPDPWALRLLSWQHITNSNPAPPNAAALGASLGVDTADDV